MSIRRKEYNPNKPQKRKRRPVIYIVCEGEETEMLYFKHFRTRSCLVDIIPISSKHKAAEHLVKHAKSLVSQGEYFPRDGDVIWCVFDCDDNKENELRSAQLFAQRQGYKIAFSNPSFEYWYLLHFEKRFGHLRDSAEIINILKNKKYLDKYRKNQDVFEVLSPNLQIAIERSKERISKLQQEGIEIISRNSNPVTTVHQLVDFLLSQRL